jgi:NADPH-dependent 2,4-dienoyl-CoA reductase/sulfur reductase-like enzyme
MASSLRPRGRIVIVGAGPAGVSAVETLRLYDRDSEVVMLSSEPYLPYSPPAMVDHFLTGSGTHLWRSPEWPAQMQLDYRPGTKVTAVEPSKMDGESRLVWRKSGLEYNRLVIASGSYTNPLPGADLQGGKLKSLKRSGRCRAGESGAAQRR